MRLFLGCILAVGLALSPETAGARGTGAGGSGAAKAADSSSNKTSEAAAKPHASAGPAKSSVESELEELRDLLLTQAQQLQAQGEQLRQQQEKMQQLEEQLNARGASRGSEIGAPGTTTISAISEPGAESAVPTLASVALPSSGATPVSARAPQAPAQPGQQQLSDLAFGKIRIGGVFYGDWAFYNRTGFGPQFLTQLNQPGPGNAHFNSFDITRTYINLLYTPTEAVTLRITPNIYRQVDVSGATAFGQNSAISSSSNGNLGFRLKYAYVDLNTLFSNSTALKNDKLTAGQTTNPLVDWEEALWGYRYVSLTPWNYLSLSSTYTGVTLHGPIQINGKEYLDYHVGVFNNASFHAIEQNDKKQGMIRLTWYPLGTTVDRTGLGITGFEDYGYSNQTPDTRSIPLNRLAVLGHYQTHSRSLLIAGEYDWGRNAFSTGNLFSGSGPADEFSFLVPTISVTTPYHTFDLLAKALLGGDRTRQRGYDFFGHVRLGNSPFALFASYQSFQPNTSISGTNPLDLRHAVAGISYHYNDHFEFAIDDQNLSYAHSQFTMLPAQIATFSPSLAAANPGGIPNVVPPATNALFINLLFNY